jgi:ribonuclease E
MANKMLIDATHPEETRVVVLRGNRVEEFDFESAQRKQLRGNIYLAKVTRVEPSLQAAFVDYGGNRHGFLAFSEIHPDYYQIPVADRQALIDEEERAQRAADDEMDRRSRRHRSHGGRSARRRDEAIRGEPAGGPGGDDEHADHSDVEHTDVEHIQSEPTESDEAAAAPTELEPDAGVAVATTEDLPGETVTPSPPSQPIEASADEVEAGQFHENAASSDTEPGDAAAEQAGDTETPPTAENGETNVVEVREHENGEDEEAPEAEEVVESVGGADAMEEVPDRAPRYRRQYKIQEVIKRRQVMLVQVVKEERGTKGAALTTYLSLAGRYSVLMPNTARGGGISRKITSSEDRARLKEAAAELEVPEGMGVILRTAGASRTKIEIKRDFEYLLRMWETVRDLTLKSTAPKLVYEEGSLVKRSIRDLYTKDIDEVTVAGTEAYHEAKDFMRMLMPSHAKNVHPYSDTQPLLSRYGVESQLDAMFSPVVQLRSGGYIVLNQAEALVAIDVNSGRATREHHIEDTALKTNLEAADEVARQLRLRDLAGLIVIDFIDMEEKRNNRSVERRLKECLKHDRARIQVGRISHFGLLEMSRQRIRTSVLESSTEKCPYCGGSGHVRSVSSLALQVLRALEEQMIRGATHNLIARTRPDVALYVLNQKRAHLRSLEERFAITITVSADDSVRAPQAFIIDRGELVHTVEAAKAIADRIEAAPAPLEEEDDLEVAAAEGEEIVEAAESEATSAPASEPGEDGGRRRRRRRRRGGRNGGEGAYSEPREQPQEFGAPEHIPIGEAAEESSAEAQVTPSDEEEAGERGEFASPEHAGEPNRESDRRRRRGRRGGRRNRHRNGSPERNHETPEDTTAAEELTMTPPAAPEPELKEAVADLDAAPRAVSQAPIAAEAPQPVPPEEPARRRSTIRERAPIGGADENLPPPQTQQPSAPVPAPTISESGEPAESARPRRTGWWSRRSAGG